MPNEKCWNSSDDVEIAQLLGPSIDPSVEVIGSLHDYSTSWPKLTESLLVCLVGRFCHTFAMAMVPQASGKRLSINIMLQSTPYPICVKQSSCRKNVLLY